MDQNPPNRSSASPTDDATWAGRLIEVLEGQRDLVGELVELADRQHQLIEGLEHTDLLDVLARRQEIIDRFTGSQEELGALSHDLEARLECIDERQRSRIRALLRSIDDRLSHVMARDATDQALLASRRDAAGRKILTVETGQQACRAYRTKPASSNRFADRRG